MAPKRRCGHPAGLPKLLQLNAPASLLCSTSLPDMGDLNSPYHCSWSTTGSPKRSHYGAWWRQACHGIVLLWPRMCTATARIRVGPLSILFVFHRVGFDCRVGYNVAWKNYAVNKIQLQRSVGVVYRYRVNFEDRIELIPILCVSILKSISSVKGNRQVVIFSIRYDFWRKRSRQYSLCAVYVSSISGYTWRQQIYKITGHRAFTLWVQLGGLVSKYCRTYFTVISIDAACFYSTDNTGEHITPWPVRANVSPLTVFLLYEVGYMYTS